MIPNNESVRKYRAKPGVMRAIADAQKVRDRKWAQVRDRHRAEFDRNRERLGYEGALRELKAKYRDEWRRL